MNGEAYFINELKTQKFNEISVLLGTYLLCKASEDNILEFSPYKKLTFNFMFNPLFSTLVMHSFIPVAIPCYLCAAPRKILSSELLTDSSATVAI